MKSAPSAAFAFIGVLSCGTVHAQPADWTGRYTELRVLDGKYLEYKVAAEDPKNLARPAAYTRYCERLKTEIQESVCEDQE